MAAEALWSPGSPFPPKKAKFLRDGLQGYSFLSLVTEGKSLKIMHLSWWGPIAG